MIRVDAMVECEGEGRRRLNSEHQHATCDQRWITEESKGEDRERARDRARERVRERVRERARERVRERAMLGYRSGEKSVNKNRKECINR